MTDQGLPLIFEYGRDTFPTTDDEAKKYLPNDPLGAAYSAYDCCREMGYSIPDAMLYVFNVVLGEPEKNAKLEAKYGR